MRKRRGRRRADILGDGQVAQCRLSGALADSEFRATARHGCRGSSLRACSHSAAAETVAPLPWLSAPLSFGLRPRRLGRRRRPPALHVRAAFLPSFGVERVEPGPVPTVDLVLALVPPPALAAASSAVDRCAASGLWLFNGRNGEGGEREFEEEFAQAVVGRRRSGCGAVWQRQWSDTSDLRAKRDASTRLIPVS